MINKFLPLAIAGIMMVSGSVYSLEKGDPCPDFSLMGTDGKTYSLAEMKGNSAFVIAWYPKAFTGGCTRECISFREDGAAIREYDALYFTASVDDVETNRKFAESLSLDYPILSDPDKKFAEALGVVDEGRPFARRWTFYVGKDGTILDIDTSIVVGNAGKDAASRLASLNIPKKTAEVNTIAGSEKAAGWSLIFNGRSHDGWITSNKTEVKAPIEEGSLVPFKSGGYLIVHEKQYGDFELSADVRMSSDKCNSGIFFRVSDLSDPVQSGFEAQVLGARGNGVHHFGAIYDLVGTSVGEFDPLAWNNVRIRAIGPVIETFINGSRVSSINTDDYPEKGKRPDGSNHKFGIIKDMARSGYLGFQDHGHKVWYRNVKVRDLK